MKTNTKTKTKTPTKLNRPPVVVIMGHIDHGKSTLLDYIRHTNLTAKEVGGITQAVGAYEAGGITFIDTPGHEAFSQMRESGACLADITILIISAEDGVKPQTLEALKIIKAFNLPYIVVINKIDKPNANAERVRQQLAEHDVLVEDYGGKIPVQEVSAQTGQGVPELLEILLLMAEMEELSGDANKLGTGFVLESSIDSKIGISATLIIKDGRLRSGDFIIINGEVSKIKILRDSAGKATKELGPSQPALVTGFSNIPPAGITFIAFSNKQEAEEFVSKLNHKEVTNESSPPKPEPVAGKIEIPLIIKADVAGAIEALKKEINKLSNDELTWKICQSGLGPISENDVKLASGSEQAIILGFNVKIDKTVQDLADRSGIVIKTFAIIYKLSEWLIEEATRQTPKVEVEQMIGQAKILKVFSAGRGKSSASNKQVIGGLVTEGSLVVGKNCKILRRKAEIGRGKIVELQRQKLATKEVAKDSQFGALVETKTAIVPGDYLEVFDLVNK